MANIGYIQVVRHCNCACRFCSNPDTPFQHTFDSIAGLIDDLVARGYFGVVLTGGEPTLHPDIARICALARSRGLHVRMISNGLRLADAERVRELADAGLQLVHVSVNSVRSEVEATIRGVEGSLERALRAIDNAERFGIAVNINTVINALNADHLHENVDFFVRRVPHVQHFVWNNLDPSMGRAQDSRSYTPLLADFEVSLLRAMHQLHRSGRTFRVERVPLCYMTEFAWASTETRKIVKSEERVVHFLDEKQTVRQTDWSGRYADCCEVCSLRRICAGLFAPNNGYNPDELYPVFVDPNAITRRILGDPTGDRGQQEW